MARNTRTIKIAIIVLATLLAASLCALTATVAKTTHYQPLAADAAVPDNVITPQATPRQTPRNTAQNQQTPVAASVSAAQIPQAAAPVAIYSGQPATGQPFAVNNMFPGDSVTQYYNVSVSHKGTVTVHFNASVRDNPILAGGLNVQVVLTNNNTILYNGTLAAMPTDLPVQTGSGNGTDNLVYAITVSLPTSAGNEYQNERLVADFNWWVVESGGGSGGGGIGGGGDTGTLAPKTGDLGLLPWAIAALLSGAAALVLRRKGGRQHG